MRMLRTMALLVVPILASMGVASFASADNLVAYLSGSGLSDGTASYNCDLVDSTGKRAHVQARAYGVDIYGLNNYTIYATQSGTSQSTRTNYPGKNHIGFLESHVTDTSNGNETVQQHCNGGWTAGWASNGTTNVSKCTNELHTSTSITGAHGSCSWVLFTAASMGNTNN